MKKTILVLFIVFLSSGCGKKKKTELAHNYYQLSMLEFENAKHSCEEQHRALAYIDKALSIDSCAEFYAAKAVILCGFKRFDESCLYFKKALSLHPSRKMHTEILNNYACALCELKKDEKALAIWNELIAHPDYTTPEVALYNQSKVFMQRKDFANAYNCLTKAVTLSPHYIDARYYLALLAFFSNKQQDAAVHVRLLLDLEPTHQGALSLKDMLKA